MRSERRQPVLLLLIASGPGAKKPAIGTRSGDAPAPVGDSDQPVDFVPGHGQGRRKVEGIEMLWRRSVGLLVVAGTLACSVVGLAPRSAAAALFCHGAPATIEVSGAGTYYGTGGPDVFVGAGGNTSGATIHALGGDDTICVGGASAIYAGSGDDLVFPFDCAQEIHGGSGADLLACGDSIWGNSGDDTIIITLGGSAFGGSGNDSIVDQSGRGFCDGGSGADAAFCTTVVNVP
jgi:hypothetical protein